MDAEKRSAAARLRRFRPIIIHKIIMTIRKILMFIHEILYRALQSRLAAIVIIVFSIAPRRYHVTESRVSKP